MSEYESAVLAAMAYWLDCACKGESFPILERIGVLVGSPTEQFWVAASALRRLRGEEGWELAFGHFVRINGHRHYVAAGDDRARMCAHRALGDAGVDSVEVRYTDSDGIERAGSTDLVRSSILNSSFFASR